VNVTGDGASPAAGANEDGRMATVLNPGSFDPIHLGHLDVIEQGVELFGHVTVAVMHNYEKTGGLFPIDQRMALIRGAVEELGIADRVSVVSRSGLAIHAAAEQSARCMIKGLRTPADFEIEQQMALTNYSVSGIRTVYLPCRADRGYISSRFVREIARYGGVVTHMVPTCVADALDELFPAPEATTR
jgi:pantetheine-phosphate adenylyltransferase